MLRQAKLLISLLLPALLIVLLLPACENDLKKVQEISAKEVNSLADTTTGVEVIYSDSAKVKFRVLTPLMLTYDKAKKPYKEMPKGVKMYVYNAKLEITNTIVADYAITQNTDKLIEFRKNVVVSTNKGDTFKSDELIYDREKKVVFTTKQWQMNKVDGTALTGTYFKSNDDFSDYSTNSGKGDIVTNGKLGQ